MVSDPYLFWFVYLIGAVAYTFFFDVPGFRRMMRFVIDHLLGDAHYTWTDMVKPANPDDSSQYPVLSQQPVLDAATTFAKRLADNGITVTENTAGTFSAATPQRDQDLYLYGQLRW